MQHLEQKNTMPHSEQINEIAAALAKAQGQLKTAAKDCINPHFKSKYSSLESIWDACREALSSNGLSVIQHASSEGDYIVVKSMLLHSSGQYISSSIGHKPQRQDIQSLGSVISYLKRYALTGLVGISTGEIDDDGESTMVRDQQKKTPLKDRQAEQRSVTNEGRSYQEICNYMLKEAEGGLDSLKKAYFNLKEVEKPLLKEEDFARFKATAKSFDDIKAATEKQVI